MNNPADAKRSAIADADAHLAAIVDSSFDAIVSKDINGIIQTWNSAAERLFGHTAEEIIGRSVLTLIPEHLHNEETDIISRIKRGERVDSFETVRRRRDGRMIAVSLTISPIRNAAGEIVGASKIARDISLARESERRIRLLMREVNHRVKNQFAVILSIIREIGKRTSTPAEFELRIRDRIMALSRSHDLLVASEWTGASLFDLLRENLGPFGHEERITLSGPMLILQPNAVQHLGMAFHELGTNSAKYGALARDAGTIDVSWRIATTETGSAIELIWDERSQPPPVVEAAAATRKGFGSVVLQRVTPQSLGGSATMERSPGHTRWVLSAPMAYVVLGPAETPSAKLANDAATAEAV